MIMKLPKWTRNAVFYEVYPQTFLDTDGDGVGDLEGIRQKLGYIRSTGATAIWLNPFYPSPMRDAGYDVADFYGVDPRYGSLEAAEQLFAEARQAGLRVIIDFVPGHTSIDHPWFRESAKSNPASPFKNWYIWTESAWDDGGTPWREKMIHGYSNRDGNFLVNFFWNQPALNFGFAEPEADKPWQLPTDHPDVQALWREMRRVLRFWLERGVDGFRVDMADSLIRNDPDKREIRRFWREAREALEPDFPELFLIAEGHPPNVLDGAGFHSAFMHWVPGYWELFRSGETFNQELGKVRTEVYFSGDGKGDFRPYLELWRESHASCDGVITVPVGNHDLPRVAVGQSEAMLEMIFAFQCAWPGIPFIYYGDEIGMTQQSSDNPIHEGHYPTRNGARTPMQWTNGKNCGFSDCPANQLYLPVDPDPDRPCVEAQEANAHSMLNRVRHLNRIHRENPAFAADAATEIISDGAPGQPLCFARSAQSGASMLCFFHPSDQPTCIKLPEPFSKPVAKCLASSAINNPILGDGFIQCEGTAWAFFAFYKNEKPEA